MKRLLLLLLPAMVFAGQPRYARLGEFDGVIDVQLHPADPWSLAERNLTLREGAWLRAQGLAPTLFCGGGWYTDASVAAACAALGYVDVTPRATRPPYLDDGAAWAQLDRPARIDLGATLLAAVPTTHGAGDLLRAVVRPGLSEQVHVYFHDTDLVDPRRRRLIALALRLLVRRRPGSDLDAVAATLASAPLRRWGDVARGAETSC